MSADSLQAACELAFTVAREDTEANHPVQPPASMRSFLYVSDLPRRAITVAQQAIEDDSDFRARVASRSSEDGVGRAGYLWLNRPPGWAQEFELLTSAPEDLTDDADLGDVDAAVDAPDPDPELEEVYNELLSSPVELVSAQPPEPDLPQEPDYSFDPGETFRPASPPIADAPMASPAMATVSPISGGNDSPPPPTIEHNSLGMAAVTDPANYEALDDANFASIGDGDTVAVDAVDSIDFEADALESELSSLRGLVDRLAGERDAVITGAPDEIVDESPLAGVGGLGLGGREYETEILELQSDLDSARHELSMAKDDLTTARHEREEAQRLHSDALKRQVDLEKELAAAREERVQVENQASEVQVSAISLEDRLNRSQSMLEEAERERNVIKSQLDIMTNERNQIREDRATLKAERDDLVSRVADVEEKSGGVDVGELSAANKSLTSDLESTSRELARMIAQAESFEEQIKVSTSTTDSLRTEKVELSSRLADTELALETTRTQHEALKSDSERLAAEVGTLRAERDALQGQLTELQTSLADVLSEQAESRQRNDNDRRTLNELRVERDVLLARMNDLEQADREYETRINSLVRERDDLLTIRDDLINERGQLRGEAAASVAEKDQLLDKLGTVESRIGPLETELQAERRQREELANRLLELDDIADQNAAELARLTEDREEMSASIEELKAERVVAAEIRVEKEALEAQLTEAESRFEDETARNRVKLTEMSEQLAAGETARTTLEQQLAEITGELDTIRLDYEEKSKELTRARLAEENSSTSIETLNSEMEQIRQQNEDLSDEIVRLQISEEAAIASLTDIRGELDSTRAEHEAAIGSLTEVRGELDASRAEHEAAIASLTEVRQELDSTRVEHEAAIRDLSAERAIPSALADLDVPAVDEPIVADDDDLLAVPTLEEALDREVDAGQTMSIDVATSPLVDAPVDPALESDSAQTPGFDWPPPDEDAPADPIAIGVAAESIGDTDVAESVSEQIDQTADVLPIVDGEEDDLDEVSELISKTVSSFSDDVDGLGTMVVDGPIAPDVEDLPAVDPVEEAEAPVDATQVLPRIITPAPSIFGRGADTSDESDSVTDDSDVVDDPADSDAKRHPGRKRRQIEVPSDILDDEVAVAQYVVSSPDVVLLVDGDSVAKLGWPSLPVAQQRDALVTYLADLSTSSGAAPDVVFDGRIGDDDSLPASRAVRIRLSTPPTEPAAALDELVDAYPEQWPIALVTDDESLAASANERGAAVLNNGQLLDLFIAE